MALCIDKELCNGCGICVEACSNGAIFLIAGKAEIDDVLCTSCETCVSLCPVEAIQTEGVSITPRDLSAPLSLGDRERLGQKATLSGVPVFAPVERVPSSAEASARVIQVLEPAGVQEPGPRLTKRLGTALVLLGREIIPYVLDGLVTTLEQRLASPGVRATTAPDRPTARRNASRAGRGSHLRRRRRVRRGRV